MEYYIDGEFDAVYGYKTHAQCLVSIGIVAYKNGKRKGSYYSLIRPKRFRRLTHVVQKITHLKNEEIRQARGFAVVMEEADQFISAHADQECRIYSFGPDDARTLRKHADYEKVPLPDNFTSIIDLQRELSQKIVWEGKIISPTLSLDDLKFVYGMKGAVIHNALNDAVDLMRIHEASRTKRPHPSRVKALWDQKEQHRREVKQRNYEKMLKVLHERYGKYAGLQRTIIFYPDVIRQLIFLQDYLKGISFSETGMYAEDCFYAYNIVQGSMRWEQQDALQVKLQFQVYDQKICVACPLTYRTGGHFDSIWHMMDPNHISESVIMNE